MWKEEHGQELSMMERQRGRGKHRAAYREEVAIQIHGETQSTRCIAIEPWRWRRKRREPCQGETVASGKSRNFH